MTRKTILVEQGGSASADMNFYASRGFLESAATVYFKGHDAAIESVRIGDTILRLLVIDGRRIVTRLPFLDYHQPLAEAEIDRCVGADKERKGRFAQCVSHGVIDIDTWDGVRAPGLELAPFVDWSRFDGFAAYRERLLERSRGLVRDRERRGRALASAHGALTFAMDDPRDDVLAMAKAWKGQQLRDLGYPDLFADPRPMEFFAVLRARGLLVSSSLRAGDRLVSLWIGFVHDGVWSGWIFAHDPELRKYSAGHQLLMRMLEESCRRGHREFDFSGCAQDYKMGYATHGRLIGNIGRPPPLRAATLFARDVMRAHSPGLFAAALRVKSAFGAAARLMQIAPKGPSKWDLEWKETPQTLAIEPATGQNRRTSQLRV